MSILRLHGAGLAVALGLLLASCGGGGGSPGVCQPACPVAPPVSGTGLGTSSGTSAGNTTGVGSGTAATGAATDTAGAGVSGAGDSTGTGGAATGGGTSSAGTAGGESGTGGSGTGGSGTAGAGTGNAGTGVAGGSGSGVGSGGTGISDGTGVAGGVGSGGTGISGDGGVGSGGTGVTADAVGIGSVDGFGSIIVNGVRHEIGSATLALTDASSLQLGVTVRVAGTVSADLSSGTATSVASAADVRGIVSALNTASLTFTVMGQTISADDSTIFSGVGALSSLVNGDIVQIYGLPGTAGQLRATRVEKLTAATSYVLSGLVQGLNSTARTFQLGTVTVQYTPAVLASPLTLANGVVVRVTAGGEPAGGVLTALQVKSWYAVPTTAGAVVNVTGLVTDYTSLASFRLQGVAVNASGAQVTGGPSSSIGNGVKVEVSGSMSGGVLVATKLRIKHAPGTGGPVSFSATGSIGQFVSSANFRVQGQTIDASGSGVVFSGGVVGDLANGRRVTVLGSQVVGGVLIAQSVTFN